jgi:hypothetical protein
VTGVIGAALAAIFTAGGTWWVSTLLDRQRENRRLFGAIGVVAAEVKENRGRIDRFQEKGLTAHDTGRRLTLGDWETNKAALSGLRLRNERLWDQVADLYAVSTSSASAGPVPSVGERMASRKRGARLPVRRTKG